MVLTRQGRTFVDLETASSDIAEWHETAAARKLISPFSL